VYKANSQFL